ncbi:JM114 [macacine gammaherpesvirus 11]|uniref:JM114 n=2 Tax=macacine gammaherpesvirus 11 TaxID=2560570 RepID=G9JMC2_9GAMA|nr:JM114 [Macaca fuscata rhadinovirus]AAT00091.1 JM114 [Macaca fuscata rhadinovirus]AEW87639.1 JM114 [Macaca fuscata rhadinovirus]AEW87809.1 JM114 [Macaca fuscata rhadinovirus]
MDLSLGRPYRLKLRRRLVVRRGPFMPEPPGWQLPRHHTRSRSLHFGGYVYKFFILDRWWRNTRAWIVEGYACISAKTQKLAMRVIMGQRLRCGFQRRMRMDH